MPVKHALLALLVARDRTGYELKTHFERTMGEFWQLNSGQVYSTLERLQRAGMITRAPGGGGRRVAARRTAAHARYALLPRGRRELERWRTSPMPRLRPVRDPLHVQLAFSSPADAARLLVSFTAESRRYAEAVETLDGMLASAPRTYAGRTRWLVAEAARLEYRAQLAWLAAARRVLAPTAEATQAAAAEGRPLRRRPPLSVRAWQRAGVAARRTA